MPSSKQPEFSDLVSMKQAAQMRSVTIQAISELVKKGRFTVYEIGGRKFLLRKDVERYRPDQGGRPRKK